MVHLYTPKAKLTNNLQALAEAPPWGKCMWNLKTIISKNKVTGYIALFRDQNDNFINIFSPWNSSENYSISISSGKILYKISPLEVAKVYENFDIYITKKNTKSY